MPSGGLDCARKLVTKKEQHSQQNKKRIRCIKNEFRVTILVSFPLAVLLNKILAEAVTFAVGF